jgi:NADH dehydrogenase/NADH:ubiquinone oxidoreductase subunit G
VWDAGMEGQQTPVCDQLNDLQDLSFEHGKGKSRFIEDKRTFEPEDIGPNIQLHMNRCILAIAASWSLIN